MTAKKKRPNTDARLQIACTVCGRMVDLPAVWVCVCGQFVICYRSACHMRVPILHLRGHCGPHAENAQRDKE